MRKSHGDKRREISKEHIRRITEIYLSFSEGEHSKIFDSTDFGYRKITVERPLRLNFQASSERIDRLAKQKAFTELGTSKKKNLQERLFEESAGNEQRQAILSMLTKL